MNLPEFKIPIEARPETEAQRATKFFGELAFRLSVAKRTLPDTHQLEILCDGVLVRRIVQLDGGMIGFEGDDGVGNPAAVLVHYTACSVRIRRFLKQDDDQPRPEVGFHTLIEGGTKFDPAQL